MRIYLFLALFWLTVALVVFIYPLYYHDNQGGYIYYPDAQPWSILGTGLSPAWLLLLFCGWNIVRWWTTWPRPRRPDAETGPQGE